MLAFPTVSGSTLEDVGADVLAVVESGAGAPDFGRRSTVARMASGFALIGTADVASMNKTSQFNVTIESRLHDLHFDFPFR